jgi:hypothetical protein
LVILCCIRVAQIGGVQQKMIQGMYGVDVFLMIIKQLKEVIQ